MSPFRCFMLVTRKTRDQIERRGNRNRAERRQHSLVQVGRSRSVRRNASRAPIDADYARVLAGVLGEPADVEAHFLAGSGRVAAFRKLGPSIGDEPFSGSAGLGLQGSEDHDLGSDRQAVMVVPGASGVQVDAAMRGR
jgi:hypothetical protein